MQHNNLISENHQIIANNAIEKLREFNIISFNKIKFDLKSPNIWNYPNELFLFSSLKANKNALLRDEARLLPSSLQTDQAKSFLKYIIETNKNSKKYTEEEKKTIDDILEDDFPSIQKKLLSIFIKNPQKKIGSILEKSEPKSIIIKRAKNAILTGRGNCEHIAAIIAAILCENETFKNNNIPFEYCVGLNLAHATIILGRDEDSNINDMTTWGNNAYIIDGWMVADNQRDEKSGVIFNVYAELKKSDLKIVNLSTIQNHLDYDFNVLRQIRFTVLYKGMVGEGYSQKWIEKQKKQNRDSYLAHWPSAENRKENILSDFMQHL